MPDDTKAFPTQSNRDPSKPWNQLMPRSMRDSGVNLDEVCGELEQAEAGLSLDKALSKIGGKR